MAVLTEGCSIRATTRLVDVDKGTVIALGVLGEGSAAYTPTSSATSTQALRLVDQMQMRAIPEPVLADMESAIDELPAASVAAHLATVPLALHVQELVRQISLRAAERRVLEHLAGQADETYGGN
jgi:hypothetical protein